jgi:hypothetical protein
LCVLCFCLFIAARLIFQLSGGCHHYRWQGCKFWPMLGTQGLWAGRDLYRATPTATRDLGLYSLIRKAGTYVPQWDSNPWCKDHQIIAPYALTTAPRGLDLCNVIFIVRGVRVASLAWFVWRNLHCWKSKITSLVWFVWCNLRHWKSKSYLSFDLCD